MQSPASSRREQNLQDEVGVLGLALNGLPSEHSAAKSEWRG
jgi:hypothetical protein